MALTDNLLAVGIGDFTAWRQNCIVSTESHCATFICHFTLINHQVDNRMWRGSVELGRIGIC